MCSDSKRNVKRYNLNLLRKRVILFATIVHHISMIHFTAILVDIFEKKNIC